MTISRMPKGIPAGGQFAATSHAEPELNLNRGPTAVHAADLKGRIELQNYAFDKLPEWPAAMPEPVVDYEFTDGKVNTTVTVNEEEMRFWDDQFEGTHNSTHTGEDPWADFDDEDKEAATAWGTAVHERIDGSLYGLQIEAGSYAHVRDVILAHATEKEPPVQAGLDLSSPEARRAYASAAEERLYRAKRELQQVYLIGAAEELRQKHPDIDSFELSSNGEEPVMEAAWDADGNQIEQHKVQEANADVFRHRDSDDFSTLMTSETIYVNEAISFRPGA